eukprot:TRINITY_DN2931_c0_g1_i1.p1 TRINITY_DN2931_c0_g1~~TRINITY_DN2931_c0_g1_i1.p1  ORF type:complete len:654 (-),score=120.24 TRINITY_DN2931_c0_g1_i1:85-2013(-)
MDKDQLQQHPELAPVDISVLTKDNLEELIKKFPQPPEELDFPQTVQLTRFIQSQDDLVCEKALEVLGDEARKESMRNKIIAAFPSFESIVRHLSSNVQDLKRLSLRLLGNLCFNNKVSREKAEAANAFVHIVEALNTSDNPSVLRVAAGCIANISSETPSACEAFGEKGCILQLLPLVKKTKNEHPEVAGMCLRALHNLCSNSEQNRTQLINAEAYSMFLSLLHETDQDEGVLCEVISCIGVICETKTLALDFIEKHKGLNLLVNIAKSCEDEEVQSEAFELLSSFSENESLRITFHDFGIIHEIESFVFGSDFPSKTVQLAAKTYANLSLNEKIVETMYQKLNLILNMLNHKDIEVQSSAAMIFGNLARTDRHCLNLADKKVIDSLIDILKDEARDMRVKHLATGALRNLSIPMANKEIFLKLGSMKHLISIFDCKNGPTIFNAVAIIKSLLSGGDVYVQHLVDLGGLEPIIQMVNNEHDHVIYESSRVVAIIASRKAYRSRIIEKGGCASLVKLISSKFPILHKEGVTAIYDLITTEVDKREIILHTPDLLLHLVKRASDLSSEDHKVQEIALEILVLLVKDENVMGIVIPCLNKRAGDLRECYSKEHQNQKIKQSLDMLIPLLTTDKNEDEKNGEKQTE